MPATFRVIAVDYDGTIADNDRPNETALNAIAELRRRGRRVLLCTGRILDELLEVFPTPSRGGDRVDARYECDAGAATTQRTTETVHV